MSYKNRDPLNPDMLPFTVKPPVIFFVNNAVVPDVIDNPLVPVINPVIVVGLLIVVNVEDSCNTGVPVVPFT